MASWKKILTAGPAMTDLASSGHGTSKFLKGDGTWDTPSSGSNYYLDGITKSSNTLTFSVNGTTNQTYEFGSNAFTSTTIPTGALAALDTVAAATITDNSVGADELNVSGDGSNGQVLTSDGDGTFSWSDKTTNTDVQWSGTSTGLTASTGRTSLGGTTFGQEVFTLADVGAVRFLRMDADNGVSALSASDFRTAIGAGTSSLAIGSTGSTAMAGNTTVDNVSVANLKTALSSGFGSNAVQIGDSDDTVTIGNDLTVTGDLLVSGDTVTVNVGSLLVEDKVITVAKGSGSAANATTAGIEVDTGNATQKPSITWGDVSGLKQWALTYEGDNTGLPIAICQIEATSGAPAGLDTIAGSLCYNNADGELYFYDGT